jgi:hypothetical protein
MYVIVQYGFLYLILTRHKFTVWHIKNYTPHLNIGPHFLGILAFRGSLSPWEGISLWISQIRFPAPMSADSATYLFTSYCTGRGEIRSKAEPKT